MFRRKVARRLTSWLYRAIQASRVLFFGVISSNHHVKGTPRRMQPIHTTGLGRISFGENVTIGIFPSPFFLSTYAYIEARNEWASISIGSGTSINNNFCAIAEHTSITIGRNCLIGTGVEILDSDFHGMHVDERNLSRPEWARPVQVGDRVFIGSNVKILKGVTIGDGSVIANGALVVKDIPAGVIAGGNPAKIIRAIE